MLTGIDALVNLTVLDLSYNRLTSVDVLKGCKRLEILFLQGNQIKDTRTIEKIGGGLGSMINLYLAEFNGQGANPCCADKAYRSTVIKSFKKLSSLDGQRVAVKSVLDMKNLGVEAGDDGGDDVAYDMGDEEFYGDEVKDGVRVNVKAVKIGDQANREIATFKSLIMDCDALLNRKTDIIKL